MVERTRIERGQIVFSISLNSMRPPCRKLNSIESVHNFKASLSKQAD